MAKKTARDHILTEKTVQKGKAKVQSDSRFKSLKSFSILSVIIFAAICIVFNILFDKLFDKTLTFDASSVQINTVGTFTRSYLKNLDKKVEIIGLFDKNDTSKEWYDYFIPIIDDYEAKADGKITVSYIDPSVNPFILTELDPNKIFGIEANTYVIRSGDRLISVDPYQCFQYDQEILNKYGLRMLTANDVELNITGSIMYVVSENPLHAYYLTGHNENTSHSNLDNILLSMSMVSKDLDLTDGATNIPSDCDIIMILQPMHDISTHERDLLRYYLDEGGVVLIVNDFSDNKTVDYTNLNEVTRYRGISMETGLLRENDTRYLLHADDPYSSLAISDPNSTIFKNGSYNSSYNRYMSLYQEAASDIVAGALLTTSDMASVDYLNMTVNNDLSVGTYPIVLKGVKSEVEGALLVFATADFTSDDYYSVKTLNDPNAEFIYNCIGSSCTTNISVPYIPEKTIPNYNLSQPLSSNAATLWSVTVMTLIPIGGLICGIAIYKRRRHL